LARFSRTTIGNAVYEFPRRTLLGFSVDRGVRPWKLS
jgi:hypothetical protein